MLEAVETFLGSPPADLVRLVPVGRPAEDRHRDQPHQVRRRASQERLHGLEHDRSGDGWSVRRFDQGTLDRNPDWDADLSGVEADPEESDDVDTD